MRHARPRSGPRPLVLGSALALAVAAGAGFGVGTAVLAGGPEPAMPDVVVAATDREPPAVASAEEPVESGLDAEFNSPDEPISGAPLLIAEEPGRLTVDLTGRASIDEAWPVDTRGDGCSTPLWPEASADTPRVLIIGDSLIRQTRASLEAGLVADGWGADGSVLGS